MTEKSENAPNGRRREESAGGLPRVLSGLDAAMLAIGVVVGTGIFAVPGFIASQLGSAPWILACWAAGGLITAAGALTYAELASRIPRQGGCYRYVLEAFGPGAAFLVGWGSFLVGFPASCAVVASILGSYFAAATGLERAAGPAAYAAILLVTVLNLRGTRFSGGFQTAVTLLKIGALGVVATLAVVLGAGNVGRLAGGTAWPGWAPLGAAMVGVLWTYDGWGNLTVVAGELTNPRRGLTRALVGTAVAVSALYLLVNAGLLLLLPMEQLRASDAPAAAAVEATVGGAGARILAGFVVVSAFGTLFGISMAGPRYFWAMADAGLFFRSAGRLGPGGAPRWGSIALAAVAITYLATGTFGDVLGYYVAVSGVYAALALAAIYPLRRRSAGGTDVFRVPGYPITPAIAILALLGVTLSEILRAPFRTGIGLALLLAAAPAYRLWRNRSAGPMG